MPLEHCAHATISRTYNTSQQSVNPLMTDLTADELHVLVRKINDIARSTGCIILDIYHSHYEVQTKEDRSPVTTADMAADAHIHTRLSQINPNIPILSEESAKIPFTERNQWQTYWLVDPLDGTREFIKGNGEFSVNIALIHKGEPIVGVVYAPVMDTLYFAYKQGGAWKQCSAHNRAKRIRVRTTPSSGPIIARSRSRQTGPMLRSFLENLGSYEEIAMGSALKSCLVAEGSADLYPRLGPTSEWDTGAAQCIVTEAGGHFTDTKMRTLRYNTKDSLLNPSFFVCGNSNQDWSAYLDS